MGRKGRNPFEAYGDFSLVVAFAWPGVGLMRSDVAHRWLWREWTVSSFRFANYKGTLEGVG